MREGEVEYYQRRHRDELRAAERASCPQAARIHRELASLYQMMSEPVPLTERLSA